MIKPALLDTVTPVVPVSPVKPVQPVYLCDHKINFTILKTQAINCHNHFICIETLNNPLVVLYRDW
ncbi:unnamed protein product [Ixodes pacificus]